MQHCEVIAARKLVYNISEKSQGAFLWVHLVVQSLLRGLVNGDEMQDLQQRFDDLPRDLETYFEHMIDNYSPFMELAVSYDLRLYVQESARQSAAWRNFLPQLLRQSLRDHMSLIRVRAVTFGPPYPPMVDISMVECLLLGGASSNVTFIEYVSRSV
jgi:hypothetical protein